MDDIHIDRITLKLSGVTEAEGRSIAQRIAEGIARADLPEGASNVPHAIRVRVDGAGGAAAMSDRAVESILRQLVATV